MSCQASYSVNRTDLAYVWYFNDKLLDFDIDPSYKIVSLVSIARWEATNSNTTATNDDDDDDMVYVRVFLSIFGNDLESHLYY